MLREFTPRLYQQSVFANATKYNTLVVLPTGLGKTGIALMMAVHRIKMYPQSKILFLAPTKPLVEQHYKTFKKHLDIDPVILTGSITPEKRTKLFNDHQVIISTPQGIQNDVISNRINLQKVSLIIFDEAHRATGEYSYVFLAHKYETDAIKPRILALTASPGSDKETITEVMKNLNIEHIEVKTEDDLDVKQYVQQTDISWLEVKLPEEFNKIILNLKELVKSKLQEIALLGYTDKIEGQSKKQILRLQLELQSRRSSGEQGFEVLKAISLAAEAIKAEHLLELVETQGITPAYFYIQDIQSHAIKQTSKAVQNLVNDTYFKAANYLITELKEQNIEHPKLEKLVGIIRSSVEENKHIKIIVFNQFRDQATKIREELNKLNISNELFFGQAKKKGKGLSQKEQKRIIEQFEDEEFNVLIATSVAEEGLDIPSVDKVIFYEPIPSAIRTVQRRGRTGRQDTGTVLVLVAKNTRDEAYRWSAHHKENRMFRAIKEIKLEHKKEKPLSSYIVKQELTIIIDHRERHSAIVKELSKQGINIELHKLDIGDYLLSENVCVEYKTQQDFVNSIVDGRLLEQVKNLTKYSKPLIILEGTEDLYSQRNVHPNAIRGMLSTISLAFRVPIISTKNPIDTASLLMQIAKQEQDENVKTEMIHSVKPKTEKEMQEYIISSLPGIGIGLAKPLLNHFGSVAKVLNASIEELSEVKLIGKIKAQKIRAILDKEY